MSINHEKSNLRKLLRNRSTERSVLMALSSEEVTRNWPELRALTRLMLLQAGDIRGLAQFDKDIIHYDARFAEMIALGQISEEDRNLRRGFHACCIATDAVRLAAAQAVWDVLDVNPKAVFKSDPSAYRRLISRRQERFESELKQRLRRLFTVDGL